MKFLAAKALRCWWWRQARQPEIFLSRHGESRTVNVNPRDRQEFESPSAMSQALGVSRADLGDHGSSDKGPADIKADALTEVIQT